MEPPTSPAHRLLRRARHGAAAILFAGLLAAQQQPSPARPVEASAPRAGASSLPELRLTMGKWIETQQLVAKEQKDWQQGKEILQGRLELVKKEIAALEDKIAKARSSADEARKKCDELTSADAALVATLERLTKAVGGIEGELRQLLPQLPEGVRTKVQPLAQRMPGDAKEVRVAVAERFQNALGILTEVDKANADLTVAVEVRTLANGSRCEVQALYIGLGQAYYVSADGEAGIGRPGPQGWEWQPAPAIARDLTTALEILQGKHSPAFIHLPAILQ